MLETPGIAYIIFFLEQRKITNKNKFDERHGVPQPPSANVHLLIPWYGLIITIAQDQQFLYQNVIGKPR